MFWLMMKIEIWDWKWFSAYTTFASTSTTFFAADQWLTDNAILICAMPILSHPQSLTVDFIYPLFTSLWHLNCIRHKYNRFYFDAISYADAYILIEFCANSTSILLSISHVCVDSYANRNKMDLTEPRGNKLIIWEFSIDDCYFRWNDDFRHVINSELQLSIDIVRANSFKMHTFDVCNRLIITNIDFRRIKLYLKYYS